MIDFFLSNFTTDKHFPLFIQYGSHTQPLYEHSHRDFSELTIVLSGSAKNMVNGTAYDVKRGDVFVMGIGSIHSYEATKDFKICNLMFKPEELFNGDYDIKTSPGFHALFVIEPFMAVENTFTSHLKLSLDEFEHCHKIISSMIDEYTYKTSGWKTLVKAYFMELVVRLSRAYQIKSTKEPSPLNLAITVAYIEKHFTEDLNIDELARQTGFSTRHFSRVFYAAYKITPGKYIMNLRLSKACSLLKGSDFSVSEVAYQCGYHDSNYFTRLFKSVYNATPSDFKLNN